MSVRGEAEPLFYNVLVVSEIRGVVEYSRCSDHMSLEYHFVEGTIAGDESLLRFRKMQFPVDKIR